MFSIPFNVSIENPSMPSPSFDGGKGTVAVTFNSRYMKNVIEFLIFGYGGVVNISLFSFGSLLKNISGEVVFGRLVLVVFPK
jgi:hypothetical protein